MVCYGFSSVWKYSREPLKTNHIGFWKQLHFAEPCDAIAHLQWQWQRNLPHPRRAEFCHILSKLILHFDVFSPANALFHIYVTECIQSFSSKRQRCGRCEVHKDAVVCQEAKDRFVVPGVPVFMMFIRCFYTIIKLMDLNKWKCQQF